MNVSKRLATLSAPPQAGLAEPARGRASAGAGFGETLRHVAGDVAKPQPTAQPAGRAPVPTSRPLAALPGHAGSAAGDPASPGDTPRAPAAPAGGADPAPPGLRRPGDVATASDAPSPPPGSGADIAGIVPPGLAVPQLPDAGRGVPAAPAKALPGSGAATDQKGRVARARSDDRSGVDPAGPPMSGLPLPPQVAAAPQPSATAPPAAGVGMGAPDQATRSHDSPADLGPQPFAPQPIGPGAVAPETEATLAAAALTDMTLTDVALTAVTPPGRKGVAAAASGDDARPVAGVTPIDPSQAGAASLPPAGPAAPVVAPPAPVGHGSPVVSIANQILPSVVALTQGHVSGDRVSITLSPDQLGRVSITVDRAADGTTSIQISAERLATLELLRTDQVDLQHALHQAGVAPTDHSLSFSWQGGHGGMPGWAGQDQPHGERRPASAQFHGAFQGDGATGHPAVRGVAAPGGVDVTA